MYGQMKPSSKHQEIVNKYIAENNPYVARELLHFNLRAYDAYMREHGITDPDQIPEDVMSQFMASDHSGKSSDDQERAV